MNAIPDGRMPTGIVFVTVFVAVSITATEACSPIDTYTLEPSGLVVASPGKENSPRGMVVITVFVVMSTTVTLPARRSVT